MDINDSIIDTVRAKCAHWFRVNNPNAHHEGRIERGAEMIAEMTARDVKAKSETFALVYLKESLRLHQMAEEEFKDDVEDAPDPKVTYAKEMETEYVQAFHTLHESTNAPVAQKSYFESALLGVLDILHKRIKNVEGGEEE